MHAAPSSSCQTKFSQSTQLKAEHVSFLVNTKAHLIFVTDTTDGVCGEKIGYVEKFSP